MALDARVPAALVVARKRQALAVPVARRRPDAVRHTRRLAPVQPRRPRQTLALAMAQRQAPSYRADRVWRLRGLLPARH